MRLSRGGGGGGVSNVYMDLYWDGLILGKYEKIFLSETMRPRSLIYGKKHHLVNLYQVCSNYAPGPENGPVRGSHVLYRLV